MYKVCLVEDEVKLNNLIKNYLEHEGYETLCLYNGEDALKHVSDDISIWILDIMLGGNISGYDLIKEIRKNNSKVPVIFTSARDQDLDKIIGLELGSDDYITKPYSPKELILRVNNLIKRVYSESSNIKKYNNYIVDIDKRIVIDNDKELNLTTLEFDLLMMFLNNLGKSFSRDDILKNIWGDDYFGSDRVVDDLVRRLRKKMKGATINTIYGYGYRMI